MNIDSRVLDALGFTKRDLATNRRGRLSARQLIRIFSRQFVAVIHLILSRKERRRRCTNTAPPEQSAPNFVWILPVTWLIFMLLNPWIYSKLSDPRLVFPVNIVYLLCVLTSIVILIRRWPIYAAEGNIHIWPSGMDKIFRLEIDNHAFDITLPAYQALLPYKDEFGAVYFWSDGWCESLLALDIGMSVDTEVVRLWGEKLKARHKRKQAE